MSQSVLLVHCMFWSSGRNHMLSKTKKYTKNQTENTRVIEHKMHKKSNTKYTRIHTQNRQEIKHKMHMKPNPTGFGCRHHQRCSEHRARRLPWKFAGQTMMKYTRIQRNLAKYKEIQPN